MFVNRRSEKINIKRLIMFRKYGKVKIFGKKPNESKLHAQQF